MYEYIHLIIRILVLPSFVLILVFEKEVFLHIKLVFKDFLKN